MLLWGGFCEASLCFSMWFINHLSVVIYSLCFALQQILVHLNDLEIAQQNIQSLKHTGRGRNLIGFAYPLYATTKVPTERIKFATVTLWQLTRHFHSLFYIFLPAKLFAHMQDPHHLNKLMRPWLFPLICHQDLVLVRPTCAQFFPFKTQWRDHFCGVTTLRFF